MNKKATYELTIADKLQQLSLPDQEDAIWARIKTQLDLELPEDDGGSQLPQSPSGGWMWSAGLLAFVAAIVTVFLLTKKSDQQPIPNSAHQHTTTQEAPRPQPEVSSQQTPIDNREKLSPSKVQTTATGLSLDKTIDSVASLPLTIQPTADTVQPTSAVVLPPPVQDSLVTPKPKSKGVRDLTDADYRIVPKKDSR